MPDKPTDKKLTFIEWLAKNECQGDIKHAKRAIKRWTYHLIADETHDGYCTNEEYSCMLCTLETMLSEYHKYFKQK